MNVDMTKAAEFLYDLGKKLDKEDKDSPEFGCVMMTMEMYLLGDDEDNRNLKLIADTEYKNSLLVHRTSFYYYAYVSARYYVNELSVKLYQLFQSFEHMLKRDGVIKR